MATTNYNVDDTAYVEVSTISNMLVNKSSYTIRVVYADSLPSLLTNDFIPVEAGRGIIKNQDLPSGNTYVRCGEEGQSSDVVVSEGVA